MVLRLRFALAASLCGAVFLSFFSPVRACDQSEVYELTSYYVGSDFVAEIRMCLGGGEALPCGLCPLTPCTSCADGADGDTRDMVWAVWGPGGNPVNILSYAPSSITGDSTGCTSVAVAGPGIGPPFNAQASLGYQWNTGCYTGPGSPRGLMCLDQSAGCGYAHQQCWDITVTFDTKPDSMRLLGGEGQGIAVGGCYPSPDMLVIFSTMPVEWGAVEAKPHDQGIEISWTTLEEIDNDHFRVERKSGNDWEELGRIPGAGPSSEKRSYSWIDEDPGMEEQQYRVVQVDKSGENSTSEVVSARFSVPDGLSWLELGAAYGMDQLRYAYFSSASMQGHLEVLDLAGRPVYREELAIQEGRNEGVAPLGAVRTGVYFVRIRAGERLLMGKFLKF